jgi:hypothetical protein
LFAWFDEGLEFASSCAAAALASFFAREDNGNIDEADLNPNLEFLGGSGGGVPSSSCVGFLSFPVWPATVLMYFCLINLSIAESASSTSMGIDGSLFSGLYILLELRLPTFRMFYHHSRSVSKMFMGLYKGTLFTHVNLLVCPRIHA